MSQENYSLILEKIGFLGRIKSMFKGAKGVDVELRKVYGDARIQDLVSQMEDELAGTIGQIRDIGVRDLNVDVDKVDGLIANVLKTSLDDLKIPASEIENPPDPTDTSTTAGERPVASGQAITASAVANNSQLLLQILQALGELKGLSAQKASAAAQDAVEKGIAQPEKTFDEIVKAVSGITGVSTDKVDRVHKWLTTNGHIVTDQVSESFRKFSLGALLVELYSCNDHPLLEGVAEDYLKNSLVSVPSEQEFSKDLEERLGEPDWTLKEWEDFLAKFDDYVPAWAESKNVDESASAELKARIEQIVKDKKAAIPATPQEAAAAKTFASLIEDIKKEVKDVTPDEAAKILAALDKLAAFKIK